MVSSRRATASCTHKTWVWRCLTHPTPRLEAIAFDAVASTRTRGFTTFAMSAATAQKKKQKKKKQQKKKKTAEKKKQQKKKQQKKTAKKKSEKMFDECVLGVRANVFTTNEMSWWSQCTRSCQCACSQQ